ncbi:MAG: hypothetical protein IIB95_02415 [Candidatus Marinimicrobia bacterium]|nr:hypothetical protein [Candidatus Neomarinimicrobiota bacterium]
MLNRRNIKQLTLMIICYGINLVFASKIDFTPVFYTLYKTSGGIWHPNKNGSANIAGVGTRADIVLNNWIFQGEFIFNTVSGITGDPFRLSPEQGIGYRANYRDTDGFWFEYSTMKISYTTENAVFEFGKFNRHWGPGLSSPIISIKPPTYPQFGFDWNINQKLKLQYFHGFLKSGIEDSVRSRLYQQVGEKQFDVPRSVAAHRLEWSPFGQLVLGASEIVIYAVRTLDVNYLIPFIPFWSIQHYLGDMDNVQMSGDITWYFNAKRKIYTVWFIDEWTPEWTFKKKDHNWFGWQAGLSWQHLFRPTDQVTIEWTWTDHRIYRHRFSVNDSYSKGYPLGFWAGPHAEELFIEYSLVLYDTRIILSYSDTKRGQLTDQMLEDQYNTVQYQRFSGPVNYEHLQTIDLLLKRKLINGLVIEAGVSHVLWKNAGFDPYNPNPESVKDVEKISLVIGFSYNFNYPGRNKIHYE